MGRRFSACESPTRSRRDRSVLALTFQPVKRYKAMPSHSSYLSRQKPAHEPAHRGAAPDWTPSSAPPMKQRPLAL
jgi:hypothetical protein